MERFNDSSREVIEVFESIAKKTLCLKIVFVVVVLHAFRRKKRCYPQRKYFVFMCILPIK